MNAIQRAIEVLQGCLEHPGADDAIAGLRAMLDQPAQTAQREPLTAEQAKTLMIEASYGFATPQEQADFLNGMRHAEIAHGITKGGT
jgi:hypothetical protein